MPNAATMKGNDMVGSGTEALAGMAGERVRARVRRAQTYTDTLLAVASFPRYVDKGDAVLDFVGIKVSHWPAPPRPVVLMQTR